MSAPALKVDKNEIRLTVMALGYDRAAEVHGIKPATLRQWARRGNWVVTREAAQKKLLERSVKQGNEQLSQTVTNAVIVTKSASESLIDHLSDCRETFQRGLGSALRKAAKHAETLDGREVIATSRKLKDLSDTAKTVLGIGQEASNGPVINIGLLSRGLDDLLDDAVIDITPRG